VGNYADAKIKYSECLENQPKDDLKIKIYNNLALACWWNKNPLIVSDKDLHKINISSELIDSDFKQVKSLFLKGLSVSENIENIINE